MLPADEKSEETPIVPELAIYHVRVAALVHDLDVVQLDVQELIHGNQNTCDGQVVLQLDGDGLAHKSLEE